MSGKCYITLHGLNLARLLNGLSGVGIPLLSATRLDGKNVVLCVPHKYKIQCVAFLRQRCYNILEIRDAGMVNWLMFLKRHLAVTIALLLLLPVLALTSNLCLRVEVENADTSTVISLLKDYGITTGRFYPDLNYDALENYLTVKLDCAYCIAERKGSVLFIKSYAKTVADSSYLEDERLDILSSADGVVTEILVLQGTACVSVGDSVTTGQILIKGETTFFDETTTPKRAIGKITILVSRDSFVVYEKSETVLVDTGNSQQFCFLTVFDYTTAVDNPYGLFRAEKRTFTLFPFPIEVSTVVLYEQLRAEKLLSKEEYVDRAVQKAVRQAGDSADFSVTKSEYVLYEDGVKATVYGEITIS